VTAGSNKVLLTVVGVIVALAVVSILFLVLISPS
jgi:hypothetical protein